MRTSHDQDVRASGRFAPLAALRAWLAGAVFGVIFVTASFADERAASLLPPVSFSAAPSFRASGNDLVPGDVPSPVINAKSRDSDFQYPTPYNGAKSNSGFDISGVWKRVLDGKIVVGSEDKKSSPKEKDADKDIETALARHPFQGAEPPLAISPSPTVTGPAPAWRWYGYGTANPSLNPFAPKGVYGTVNSEWYPQSGATPGAIPCLPSASLGNELPFPSTAEPSRARIEPPVQPLPARSAATNLILPPDEPVDRRPAAGLQAPTPPTNGLEIESNPKVRPANLEVPSQPLSARSTNAVSRAQSPDLATLPNSTVAALRSACVGYVTKIELQRQGPRKIGMKLKLAQGIQADRLADRIAKIPELAGYQIEMEFAR